MSILSKKRYVFDEKHSKAIDLYKYIKEYLDGAMNGRTKLPINNWKAEQKKLLAERYTLVEAYCWLQNGVWSVEVLRKGAGSLMREESLRGQPQRTQNMEL